ncbi:MAG: 4Fe-4S binding protein [Candidatus Melainabacteria bacterium]|nr:4Fe-4S binding protein [Candidatus Melainabacteria bacterium]
MNPMINTTSHVIKDLEQQRFFKLVCGASLTDVEMIERLTFIFTLAGAHVIDLAPSADVIFAARRGVEKAIELPETSKPLLMASIQLDKDPHFRKAEVDYNLCDLCSACVKVCPTEAFKIENKKFIYSIEKCYGCGICPQYCHVNALSMVDTKPSPKETLTEMISLGVKSIEFHFGKNFQKVEEIWTDVRDLVKKLDLISFSIGSDLLSDEDIKKAADLCYRLAGSRIILQCDGTPMSGGFHNNSKKSKIGNNSNNSSLHVARIIQEEKLPVYLQISGGTDENSFTEAIDSGVNINGVAIGSYARKLLMPYLTDLEENLNEAVMIAKTLVDSVSGISCKI